MTVRSTSCAAILALAAVLVLGTATAAAAPASPTGQSAVDDATVASRLAPRPTVRATHPHRGHASRTAHVEVGLPPAIELTALLPTLTIVVIGATPRRAPAGTRTVGQARAPPR